MATLGNPQKTIEIIQKYQFAFQKNLVRISLLINTFWRKLSGRQVLPKRIWF